MELSEFSKIIWTILKEPLLWFISLAAIILSLYVILMRRKLFPIRRK